MIKIYLWVNNVNVQPHGNAWIASYYIEKDGEKVDSEARVIAVSKSMLANKAWYDSLNMAMEIILTNELHLTSKEPITVYCPLALMKFQMNKKTYSERIAGIKKESIYGESAIGCAQLLECDDLHVTVTHKSRESYPKAIGDDLIEKANKAVTKCFSTAKV